MNHHSNNYCCASELFTQLQYHITTFISLQHLPSVLSRGCQIPLDQKRSDLRKSFIAYRCLVDVMRYIRSLFGTFTQKRDTCWTKSKSVQPISTLFLIYVHVMGSNEIMPKRKVLVDGSATLWSYLLSRQNHRWMLHTKHKNCINMQSFPVIYLFSLVWFWSKIRCFSYMMHWWTKLVGGCGIRVQMKTWVLNLYSRVFAPWCNKAELLNALARK